jgi:hypothetical protein
MELLLLIYKHSVIETMQTGSRKIYVKTPVAYRIRVNVLVSGRKKLREFFYQVKL